MRLKISARDIPNFKTLHTFIPFNTCMCMCYQKKSLTSLSFFFKFFHSVHSCTSNTSSVFQPNAYDILNIYFIKSLLHAAVCYTPSSGRTS
jgi:hypothetical protein